MKKHIKLLKCCVIGISLMFIGGFILGCSKDNSPYPKGGRDTYEQFGDRRFVILKGINPIDETTRTYCLYDQKEDADGQIEGNIINYIDVSPYIYTIGTNGTGPFYEEEISDSEKTYYTKVNYETGDIIQKTDLSIFSDEDKKVFEDLSNSESPFKDK